MTRTDHGESLPEETAVDQVVLRVGSAAEVAGFYRRVVGLTADRSGEEVRLSAGDGDALIVLRERPDAPERDPDAAGLYHLALRVPDRPALAAALRRIRTADHPLDGAADHVASEALYLSDPEGNGVEVYADRPREEWEYTDDGQVRLPGDPLDLAALEEGATDDGHDGIHPDADVGHVHFETTDLDRSTAFYCDVVGFNRRLQKPRATFLAGGDYHHHLAINTRRGRSRPYDPDALGLESVAFSLPHAAFEALVRRLGRRGVDTAELDGGGSDASGLAEDGTGASGRARNSSGASRRAGDWPDDTGRSESVTVTDPDGMQVRFVPR